MINVYICALSVAVLALQVQQVATAESSTGECRIVKVDYERGCGEKSLDELETLKQGECAEIIVNAASCWNASGLQLEKDATYDIKTMAGDYWCDADTKCGADGWRIQDENYQSCNPEVEVEAATGIKRWLFLKSESIRRFPDADWFELIGVNAANDDISEFRIAKGIDDHQPVKSGEFCAYANDLSLFYWNNSKSLKITVRRTK